MGKKKGNGRRRRGCERCGNKKYSCGRWCFCNRASGVCSTCGVAWKNHRKVNGRVSLACHPMEGYIPPHLGDEGESIPDTNKPVYERGMLVAPDGAALVSFSDRKTKKTRNSFLEICKWCGCSQHLDCYGDRVCWCDVCSLDFDWESAIQGHRGSYKRSCRNLNEEGCKWCGCSQNLDNYGDRVCYCDVCSLGFDWESALQYHRRGIRCCKKCGDGVCWCEDDVGDGAAARSERLETGQQLE